MVIILTEVQGREFLIRIQIPFCILRDYQSAIKWVCSTSSRLEVIKSWNDLLDFIVFSPYFFTVIAFCFTLILSVFDEVPYTHDFVTASSSHEIRYLTNYLNFIENFAEIFLHTNHSWFPFKATWTIILLKKFVGNTVCAEVYFASEASYRLCEQSWTELTFEERRLALTGWYYSI